MEDVHDGAYIGALDGRGDDGEQPLGGYTCWLLENGLGLSPYTDGCCFNADGPHHAEVQEELTMERTDEYRNIEYLLFHHTQLSRTPPISASVETAMFRRSLWARPFTNLQSPNTSIYREGDDRRD